MDQSHLGNPAAVAYCGSIPEAHGLYTITSYRVTPRGTKFVLRAVKFNPLHPECEVIRDVSLKSLKGMSPSARQRLREIKFWDYLLEQEIVNLAAKNDADRHEADADYQRLINAPTVEVKKVVV